MTCATCGRNDELGFCEDAKNGIIKAHLGICCDCFDRVIGMTDVDFERRKETIAASKARREGLDK